MKKIFLGAVILVLLMMTACTSINEMTSKSTDKTINTLTSTDTPIPTYAPGTELYGMLSATGEVVIEPRYEYLDLFSEEGLARFCDHGLWGFVNTEGIEVIPAHFEDANSFSEGLAAVKIDGLWGFIDESGEMVIEPQFESVESGFSFEHCVVFNMGKHGIINRSGVWIIEPEYQKISLYCESYFICQAMNGSYGLINRNGELIGEEQTGEIYSVTDSGYYFIHGSDIEGLDQMISLSGEKFYVKDFHYTWALYNIKNDSVIPYSDDGRHWGLIDLTIGGYALYCVYDQVWYTSGNEYAMTYQGEVSDVDVYEPSMEYVMMGQKGRKGMIRVNDGKEVLECDNLYCEEQFGNIIYQDTSGQYGVIDSEGNTIVGLMGKQVVCSTEEYFAESLPARVYDVDGNLIWENSDIVIMGYVPSIDCWTYYTRENSGQDLPNIGFISLDGEFITEDVYSFGHINYPQTVKNLPRLTNVEIIPILARNEKTLQNELILSNGTDSQYLFDNAYIFPYKGVIVVFDEEGQQGIMTNCGDVVIKTGDNEFVTDEEYLLDDSDYLIYRTTINSIK